MMSEPTGGGFPQATLEIDNIQSREEDEDLEEQRRRQEELTDLLATGIHAFNYDESTINSSSTSIEPVEQTDHNSKVPLEFNYNETSKSLSKSSLDNSQQNYRDASSQDQLKVLYEVRVREIHNLREEFAKYQAEKSKEISVLKNKVTFWEAENRHLQLSAANLESLLVEKTDIIKNLKESITAKDGEVETLKKNIDKLKLDLCAYAATVNELQFKLADSNPFSAQVRSLNSDESQKSHQNQIVKAETHLLEQTKKIESLEKENARLNAELKEVIKQKENSEKENNLTIVALSKKLQSCQQQCKDLFLLGEAIKKESDHFKDRMLQLEANKLDELSDSFRNKSVDKETLIVHLEKFKRMLLDKDIEVKTLKAKLKFYDSDLEELFEYRKLLNNMHEVEIRSCNNIEHSELLIFLQRQLQSYQQAVEDRNQQIINLNVINRELREKIEEMIQQTRTDIQNLSERYSLPKLEVMSDELKKAEATINELKRQLADHAKSDNIDDQLAKCQEEKRDLEESLSAVKKELVKSKEEAMKLKQCITEFEKTQSLLQDENDKLKLQVQKSDSELNLSDRQMQVQKQLHEVAEKLEQISSNDNLKIILKLRSKIQKSSRNFTNSEINKKEIAEKFKKWTRMLDEFINNIGPNMSMHNLNGSLIELNQVDEKLRDKVEELTNAKTMLEGEKFALEYQVKSLTNQLEEVQNEIAMVKEANQKLSSEQCDLIQKLKTELSQCENTLQILENDKKTLEENLRLAQKETAEAKQAAIDIQKTVTENNEKLVKESLVKELKDMENVLEQSKAENNTINSEHFQNCLQAEILKAELLLRDRLQEEALTKIKNIEEQYKKVLSQKTEIFNKAQGRWQNQETMYRKKFASVLEECGQKVVELENRNLQLNQQLKNVTKQFELMKSTLMQKYQSNVSDTNNRLKTTTEKWSHLLGFCVAGYMNIEKQSDDKMQDILNKIKRNDNEIDLIKRVYEEKINNIKLKTINHNQK